MTIFLMATLFGGLVVWQLQSTGEHLDFYQSEYGPAVALACGRGYVSPVASRIPPLNSFLRLETTTFDCGSLPAQMPADPQLNTYHRTARYLIGAVALVWRVTGVSWNAVAILAAMLFGATSTAVYAIARLAIGRPLSLLIAALITGSTLNLLMLRYLRDYAKAPFMLWALFAMAWLVTRAASVRGTVVAAAAGGAIVGVGFGFRNDLLMVVAPFLITTACLLPPWAGVRVRAYASAAFVVAFLLIAAPVLADYAGGSNTGHVAVLGLTEPFDGDLGIRRSIYSYGHHYADGLGNAIITTYADRALPQPGGVGYLTPEYDAAAVSYLVQVARTCPGDLIVRAYAAITSMPYLFLEQYQYPALPGRIAHAVYGFRAAVDWKLRRIAPLAVGAAVALVALANVRAAAFMVLIAVVLMGGTAIQFHPRHFFYFEFVPFWAFAFLLTRAAAAASPLSRATMPRAALLRGAAFVVVIAVGALGALWLARAYQSRRLLALFDSLDAAQEQPLGPRLLPAGQGRVLMAADRPAAASEQERRFSVRYLKLSGDLAGCRIAAPLRVRAQYAAAGDAVDLSQDLPIAAGSETRRVDLLYPVYERAPDIRFLGFEVDAESAPCLRVALIADAQRFPLLLTTDLSGRWQGAPLYQTLTWHR